MGRDPVFILAIVGCLVVAGILMWGIGTFTAGNDDNGKKSNKIMQYRIIAQFVVVIVIVGIVWLRQLGGN
ncbi:twin transmembrane helix small protein [Octadecabacter sp. R77987]|uniref:twin transmembrane helix small protein n=1 Tax=Octadecabacter sp. R77987 TaxID=3093874 RepID=UPI00366AE0F6